MASNRKAKPVKGDVVQVSTMGDRDLLGMTPDCSPQRADWFLSHDVDRSQRSFGADDLNRGRAVRDRERVVQLHQNLAEPQRGHDRIGRTLVRA